MNVSPVEATPAESWLGTARRPEIVRRALRIATIVGTVLIAINYTDRILADAVSSLDWFKMGVTYLVPYCVSTYSSVEARREQR